MITIQDEPTTKGVASKIHQIAAALQLDAEGEALADDVVAAFELLQQQLDHSGMPRFWRPLNAMLLGEIEAQYLGFDVDRAKRRLIVLVALVTGAGVAVSGVIGFVGLVTPHLVRLSIGPDHRYLLPCSALLGGSLLLLADIAARTVVLPAELPIGIVTACFGAPFFLWLLARRRDGHGFF